MSDVKCDRCGREFSERDKMSWDCCGGCANCKRFCCGKCMDYVEVKDVGSMRFCKDCRSKRLVYETDVYCLYKWGDGYRAESDECFAWLDYPTVAFDEDGEPQIDLPPVHLDGFMDIGMYQNFLGRLDDAVTDLNVFIASHLED